MKGVDWQMSRSFQDWSDPIWNRIGLLQLMLRIIISPSKPENPTLALKSPKLEGDQWLHADVSFLV